MRFHGLQRCVLVATVALAAGLAIAPSALARTHVSVGINLGLGNCWGCGYAVAPPAYYPRVRSAPVYYYPGIVYYAPPRVYYPHPRAYRRGQSYRHHIGNRHGYGRAVRGHGRWGHHPGRGHRNHR